MKLSFLNSLPTDPKDLATNGGIIIAMKPTVHAWLLRQGIELGGLWAAENTLPYFTNASHEAALLSSDAAAQWLRAEAKFLETTFGIEYAYREMFIFLTRFAIHYCLWVIDVVQHAIDKHQPTKLLASCQPSRPTGSFYIESCENYLAKLVRVIAQQRGIPFEIVRSQENSVSGKSRIAYSFLRRILKSGHPMLATARYKWLKKRLPRRKKILYTTTAYQMDLVIEDLKSGFPNIDFELLAESPLIPSRRLPPQWGAFQTLVDKLRHNPSPFSYLGIPFGDLVAQKIEDNIAPYLVGYLRSTPFLDRWLDLLEPAAVLSNANRADDKLLAELCRKKGIPNIVISHGSHISPKNDFERIEWGEHGKQFLSAPYSHIALQSPIAEGYIDAYKPDALTLKTGPLIWGRKVRHQRKTCHLETEGREISTAGAPEKIVLHAGTPKITSSLRFQIYETPDEYIQSLKDLSHVILRMENVRLVIKFRPMEEISIKTLTTLLPDSPKIIIEIKQTFRDSLSRADLLVSFSSTTIEEALQNQIPVLLYGGNGRYQHIPAQMVKNGIPLSKSALYFAPDFSDLEFAVRGILDLKNKRAPSGDEKIFEPYIYGESQRESLLGKIL